jgi:DNA ligase-1
LDFQIIADAYENMTKITSRIQLTRILSEVLKDTPRELIDKVVYMTQGRLRPDFEGVELGMAEKSVSKAMQKAYGSDQSEIQVLIRKKGDIGDVAAILSEKRTQQSLFVEKLTVEKVYSSLDEVARRSGAGSTEFRIGKIASLLNSASKIESKFLVRFVTGKLRLGVADFTVLDALALAFTGSKENRVRLEKAYNLSSDLGLVAKLLVEKGIVETDKITVRVGNPVRPMLAERLGSPKEILQKMGGTVVAEYKLDGERIQAHKIGAGKITLFSRRLEVITSHYSDVVKNLYTISGDNFILEGEVVAIDSKGKYLPFQELMHRRRKYGMEKAIEKYPACLNVFDLLFLDGDEVLDLPFRERRKKLEKLFAKSVSIDQTKILLVPSKSASNPREIEGLMDKSLKAGCEGLVVKDPNSPYRAGARGFAWIKYKPEYKEGIRDTIDLVIVGANHGMGRRAGHYGNFLLAAYDKEADLFRTTTKIGTGFSDLELEDISKTLQNFKIDRKSARVDSKVTVDDWFEPKMVIEVIASEITLSPIYTAGLDKIRKGSGLALRFPKFTGKIRDDKAAEDATTVLELLEMYQLQSRQFKENR